MRLSPLDAGAANPPACSLRAWDNSSCVGARGLPYLEINRTRFWRPFAAPPRVVFAVSAMRCTPNPELGQPHVRLPVTHTRTMNRPLGVWWYYARGCSDLGWDTGRTLAVRNRCHAAVEIDQRVHRDGTRRAIERISHYYLMSDYQGQAAETVLPSAYVRSLAPTNDSIRLLQLAMHQCVRGVFGTTSAHCNVAAASAEDSCAGTCRERVKALSPLAGVDYLDGYIAVKLRSLAPDDEVDSIQLLQQPHPGCTRASAHCGYWTTELWDVRTLLPSATAKTPVKLPQIDGLVDAQGVPTLEKRNLTVLYDAFFKHHKQGHKSGVVGWLNGSACNRGDAAEQCRSCAGSLLEAACGFHCGRAGNFVPNPHLRPDIDTARLVGMPTGESTLADVVPSATVRPAVDELWHAEATACVRNAEARRRRGKTGCSGFT